MLIEKIIPNPNNPRTISDKNYNKLVKSIKEFPKMLELRPIVIDEDNVVLGGNMRLSACIEAGLTEVPVVLAKDLSEEEKKEFIVKDNIGYGEWNYEDLLDDWSIDDLSDWGLEIPDFNIEPEEEELVEDVKESSFTLTMTFRTLEDLERAEVSVKKILNDVDGYYSVKGGAI